MKNKYTILFIPPDHSTTRQIQFSQLGKHYIGAGILLLGVIIIGLFAQNLYLSHYMKKNQSAINNINQLKSTIEVRNQEISHLNEKSTQITKDLSGINDLEAKLASILKLQPFSTSSTLSRGSSATPQSYTPSSSTNQSLDQNATMLATHLSLLQQYYDAAVKQENKFQHTPSILPVQGAITSYFGYRRNPFGGWSTEFHNGIDIACNYGTPVLATADGIVTFAGWDSAYGQKVEIDHSNGIVTFYGHNSRLMVKSGDQVKKNDMISYSGNSGRSTGSHLHYGAIINEKNADPLTFTNSIKEQ